MTVVVVLFVLLCIVGVLVSLGCCRVSSDCQEWEERHRE